MTIRQDMLRAKAREIAPELERATDIAQKAADENRDLTRDERTAYDEAMKKAKPIIAGLRAAREDAAFEAHARGIFDGGGTGGSKSGQRLSFKNMAAGIGDKMLHGHFGEKSLAPSGSAVVTQGFTEDPVPLGRVATGLLDVLPVQVQSSPSYAYLRQTVRDNAAAVVADYALKPVTELGLVRVENTLAVVAHLSEPIPRFWVSDNSALETFVTAELEHGLRLAIEAKVIEDVNDTSGIQAQAFSVSTIETIRRALTKIEVAGHTAGAIVLHPETFAEIEILLASSSAVEYQGLPYLAAQRLLYGIPIAVTVSQEVNVAHVLAAGSVVLDVDSLGVGVMWSENAGAETFARNEIVLRVEQRVGVSTPSALGIVVADLVA